MPTWIDNIPEVDSRYILGECLATGINGTVYKAEDTEAGNRNVAVKVQKYNIENESYILEEYVVLKDFSDHSNLPDFYGAFKKTSNDGEKEIWFVMELCEGGSIMDMVKRLYDKNRRMVEEHIALILKETVKALIHLHKHQIIHRHVCGSNILLTKNGEIKLAGLGLARSTSSFLEKRSTCVGSACWMAPEMVKGPEHSYDNRADVWSLGITAIELGDAKPPFHGMHPTRAMFQIVRNPPPGLYRPGSWTEQYNDFVSECLEKNPEYRPFMEELLGHPFLTVVPENYYYLTQELKKINEDLSVEKKAEYVPESLIRSDLFRTSQNSKPENMYMEDLAAIKGITDDLLLNELKGRFSMGHFQTFVGDVLLVLNPNEFQDVYEAKHHLRYNLKSRSDNPPHVYAVADRAYQDALHHEEPQYVVLAGESGSGKTTTMKHLLSHLLFLGKSKSSVGDCIEYALNIVHAFTNSATPINNDSTRCLIRTQLTFGATGKVSGVHFDVYQLEKWRISSTDMSHANFHILYYFYDAMLKTDQLNVYSLDPDRKYRYLRISSDITSQLEVRNNPKENVQKFISVVDNLKLFDTENDQIETICKVLSAILNLGEIQFHENEDNLAEISNAECCSKVAELLCVDEKKFTWCLTNYCFVEQGTAIRRRHTCDQARDARDMLANSLYSKLVDWIVSIINNNMARNRAIYGDKYFISILDYFGFECFKRNDFEQLLVNTTNEQMQYHYIQRVFAWESLEQLEEELPPTYLDYYNNKEGVDKLLGKPTGILSLIDEASKTGHNYQHIFDSVKRSEQNPYISITADKEFYFSHYTGKIIYDIREMSQKNRSFLPPEIIETLRLSSNITIRELFVNKITRTGNLIFSNPKDKKNKWSSALMAEQEKSKKLSPEFQCSQTKHMRTAITTFRSVSLEILRELSVGAGSGGTHFIRCIRTNLKGTPKSFHHELIKQQIQALSVVDTARARQYGYPHRIKFPEFLRRYKFLAFDFDENVDVTKENCRLLLVRLKMQGWQIGKTKVFLKYYNEEYLSRLYETQVKKIVKIQAMMRAFLAKRNVASKLLNIRKKAGAKLEAQKSLDLSAEAAAALLIQKAYRGYNVRKKYGPLVNKESGQLDDETVNFLKPFVKKWKSKSIFQVLLQYRSAKFQDLINLSQQIHIFNQNVIHELQQHNNETDLEKVDPTAKPDAWLGNKKPSVWKLPFHFDEIPYYDTEHMCENSAAVDEDQETWDSPLQWRQSIIKEMKIKDYSQIHRSPTPIRQNINEEALINLTFSRDPLAPISDLPQPIEHEKNSRELSLPTSPQKTVTKLVEDSPKHKILAHTPKKIQSPAHSTNSDKNFEGANQDFEFIRSPSFPAHKLKLRSANPIAELESIGRKNVDRNTEDDPPFNFRGMLRKTNFQRNSLKKIPECKSPEEIPYRNVLKSKANKENIEANHMDGNVSENGDEEKPETFECIMGGVVSTELAPGVVLNGVEINI